MVQSSYHDRPNTIPWPPLVIVLALAVSLGLGIAFPLDGYTRFAGVASVWFGVLLIVTGLGLDVWALSTFWRAKANVLPHAAATALLTHGPFRISRNPIYLGNTLFLLGLGFAFDNFWFIPAAIGGAVAVHFLAIAREETHLDAKFGDDWKDYAQKVPRWIAWF